MATNNLLLLLSMIAIKATRQGKRRLHWPMVEPGLVAGSLVQPAGLVEQVVLAVVVVHTSVAQVVPVVGAASPSKVLL